MASNAPEKQLDDAAQFTEPSPRQFGAQLAKFGRRIFVTVATDPIVESLQRKNRPTAPGEILRVDWQSLVERRPEQFKEEFLYPMDANGKSGEPRHALPA